MIASSLKSLRATAAVALALLAAWASGPLSAQPREAAPRFPARVVTFVLPGPAGGGPDQVVRILGESLSGRWGVPVVVENKPGATGTIGAESVARGDPSGHRLLFAFTALVQAPAIFAKVPYNLDADFAPVLQVANAPVFLAVAADSPIRSLADFIARGKQPGKGLSYGSFGTGSSYHVYGEALKKSQGLNLLHVPYKGEAFALTDLLGGQIDASFVSVGTGAPHVRAGKLRPLALVSKVHSAVLPEIPTFAEAGVPELDAVGWFGVLAPAGTPAPVLQQLSADLRAVLREPAILARLKDLGFDPVAGSDPVAFRAFLAAESRKWKTLITDAGVKPE